MRVTESTELVELYEFGDVVITLQSEQDSSLHHERYLASSHVLRMTSPVFRVKLGTHFNDGRRLHEAGIDSAVPISVTWREEYVSAMAFILKALHARAQGMILKVQLPHDLSVRELAFQVDKYSLVYRLERLTSLWFESFKRRRPSGITLQALWHLASMCPSTTNIPTEARKLMLSCTPPDFYGHQGLLSDEYKHVPRSWIKEGERVCKLIIRNISKLFGDFLTRIPAPITMGIKMIGFQILMRAQGTLPGHRAPSPTELVRDVQSLIQQAPTPALAGELTTLTNKMVGIINSTPFYPISR